jgi:PAS domain S-box-containing protein
MSCILAESPRSVTLITPGYSFLWQSEQIWIQVVSDTFLALAYYALALIIAYFLLIRKRVTQARIPLILLILSLLLCATIYLLAVYLPESIPDGLAKIIAALPMLAAVFFLIRFFPRPVILSAWPENGVDNHTAAALTPAASAKATAQGNEDHYRALMDIFDSVVVHVGDRITFANPAAVQLLGGSGAADIVGKRISHFIPEEFRELAFQRFAQLKSGEKTAVIEQKIKRLDGSLIDIEVLSIPYWQDGRFAIQTIARDISQRKQKERDLRRKEARLRGIFNSAITGIFFLDERGTITEANDTFLELIGYSRSELMADQLSWESLIPAEYAGLDKISIENLLASGTVSPCEKEIIRKDGHRIPVLIGATVLPDSQQIVMMVLDVTEQKRAQERIADSEERFRLAAMATNDVIWDLNLLDGSLWWSDQLTPTFGHPRKAINSSLHEWARLVHPEDNARVLQKLNTAIVAGDKQWSDEYRLLKGDNTYAHVLDRGHLLHDKSGKAVRMVGAILDLTHLRETMGQLEQRSRQLEQNQLFLQASEAKFRQIFESNVIGIFFANFAGTIVDSNNFFLEMLGYNREELERGELQWNTLTPPEYADRDAEAVQELMENRLFKPFEKEYIRKDGSRVPVLLSGSMLEGYRDLGMGFVVDITERYRAEETLRQTLEELQIRNHELDNYVYKVSHDLRAPLASVLGLINLINLENNPAATEKYLPLIENRVLKLDGFVQSIINHSKTLNTEVVVAEINFEQLIREAYDELRYLKAAEQLHLIIDWNPSQAFYNDTLRMGIIIKNFLSNAIKFINPFAEKNYVKFTIDVTDKTVFIEVEDNGMGIEPQYLSKVFDMFFRASDKSDGSGLGLYIVKQTVEKLRGSVCVASELGRSTTFRITLPNLIARSVPEPQVADNR